MALALEDFGIRQGAAFADSIDAERMEAEKSAAYEQGYKAGWDDAVQAEAADQERIGAELARHLQEMTFSFHEARTHVIQSVEPLLHELFDTLLPEVVRETLGMRIIEVLQPMIESAAEEPVELAVSPANRAALERQLDTAGLVAFRLVEEPSLADGQAFLRVGRQERKVDLGSAMEQIAETLRALTQLNERALKHG